VSTTRQRPHGAPSKDATPGGLSASQAEPNATSVETLTLGSLPVGARLILRCRADWRAATVAAFEPETARVVLNVASPTGHTYRVRRPEDSPLTRDGEVPVLGEGRWRVSLARYDIRW
jgi:hypothetical protein